MYFGTTPLTIAKGIVYPPAAGDQLRPNYLRVAIEKITQDWAVRIPLPVPVDEMVVLDDARYSTVQWPKNQIILDNVRKLQINGISYSNHSFQILEKDIYKI